MSLLRIRKPKTRKGKKILIAREPQINEPPKSTVFIEGRKCSGPIKQMMKDVFALKKPLCKALSRKNDISPFEDASSLEFLTMKNDCGIFMFGSTSKKRPDNLVMGRIFENELLDMVELGIKQYRGLSEFKNEKIGTCVKPCLIFNGPKWGQTEELRRLKNLLIDLFHRDHVDAIRLQGIEHAVSLTVTDDMTISLRSYKIQLKKSGQKTPRVELTEMGPSADLAIRRTKIASDELYKQSRKQPKELKVHKKKNITKDNLGTTHGRVHITRQSVSKLQTRKMKGLRKTPAEKQMERKKKKDELKKAKLAAAV